MQIRIWSESVVGGIHTSLKEAPTSSMFARAGKGDPCKEKDQANSSMSDALTNGFVSGGYLPEKMRGQKTDGYIHIADWYATLSEIGSSSNLR